MMNYKDFQDVLGVSYVPGSEYGDNFLFTQPGMTTNDVVTAKRSLEADKTAEAIKTAKDITIDVDPEPISPTILGYVIELEEFLARACYTLECIFKDFDGISYHLDAYGNIVPYIGFFVKDTNNTEDGKSLYALKKLKEKGKNERLIESLSYRNAGNRNSVIDMHKIGVEFSDDAIDILAKYVLQKRSELADDRYRFFKEALCLVTGNARGYNNVNVYGISLEKLAALIHGFKYDYRIVVRNNGNKKLVEVSAINKRELGKLARKVIGTVSNDFIRASDRQQQ